MYAGLSGYSDVGNGPHTHYVDNSAGCSDTGNANGSMANPRCTVPTTLAAGSVVEIHGGPYTGGGDIVWRMNGTANQPVFIRGIGKSARPVFTGEKIQLTGTYGIVEFIDVNQADVEWPGPSDHISLRHSHALDHPGTGAIVDNDIHHNAGDAIQFCHGCIGSGVGPANVYVGRNTLHEDEENALDLKEFIGPVIISENTIYGYVPGVFSGNGDAIRVNDEGTQGDVWIIYNDISNSTIGIGPGGSDGTVYAIGNILHDFQFTGIGPGADFVINNTIYNVQNAIVEGETKSNLISNASNIVIDNGVSGCSNNLVNGGSVRGSCANTVGGDPQFVFDANNKLVGIQASSPAIGSGYGDHAVFQLFQSTFGIDIRVDANGNPRAAGVPWAAGAHEGAGSTVRPMAPTNLSVDQSDEGLRYAA